MTLPLPSSISVEEVGDRAAIAGLAADWERLRDEVGASGPFFGPTWFAICAAAIADELRILVAHRRGRLVGILPLMLEQRRLAGLPARVLRSLSDDHSQRFDALVAEPEAATALWRHLRSMRDWDALELRELPEGAAAIALVDAARRDGHPTAEWPAMRSPYLHINDAEPGSAKFRSSLRRRKKKLEAEVGPVSLERLALRGPELEIALDEGFALEAAGWKGAGGTAIACDPLLRRRYLQIAQAYAARGELAVYFLRTPERRIAFHFGLVDGQSYFLFKPGFDPALSQFGLGHLLVDEVIRDLRARGVRELDFLGDDLPWKREWTDQLRPHSWRYVFSRSAWGRALAAWKFHVAPTVKRLLSR